MKGGERKQKSHKLRGIKDEKEQQSFKAHNLPFATFSGTFNYRNEEGLVQHSGLICFDVDHLPSEEAVRLCRNQLRNDPHLSTGLSKIYPHYDYTGCDKKYNSCMNGKGSGTTISTLFHFAKEAGIDIGGLKEEVCAKNAKVHYGTNSKKGVK